MCGAWFLEVPVEIFLRITDFSSLDSIARLCQVCKRFAKYILQDKGLWIERLRSDVISKSIKLPWQLVNLENASADVVRLLVKSAILLHLAYEDGGTHAQVRSFLVDETLESTWVKIVRGRWCLVAMSNISESYIDIWRIWPTNVLRTEYRYYLPGPVIDGAIDDTTEVIQLAVTVATVDPYIEILSFNENRGTPHLSSLYRLPGARHVLLLSDSLIGYATICGDDTYPLLANWRTGATIRLRPLLYDSEPSKLLGDIHSPCRGMRIWKNHVFLVLDCSLEIFVLPNFGSSHISAFQLACQSIYFPILDGLKHPELKWIDEACFHDAHHCSFESTKALLGDVEDSLHISIRDRSLHHSRTTVTESPGEARFSWNVEVIGTRNRTASCRTLEHIVGSSNGYQVRLASSKGLRPMVLEVMRPRPFPSSLDISEYEWIPVLPTCGLPSLECTSAMDFDDGSGVIVLGSCRGEICVIQIGNTSPGFDLGYDLPSLCGGGGEVPDRFLTPMDLPYCYHVSDKIHDRVVPEIVREQTLESWRKTYDFPEPDAPPGWSRDWRRHTSIHNWVLPFPRWRTLSVDQQFHDDETWNRFVRTCIGCRGDIVPIMYHEEHHDFVIFKIAQRLYFFNKGANCEDDEHRICSLPYSERDLGNPAVLEHVYENRWNFGPLHRRVSDMSELAIVNDAHLKLLDFLKTRDGQLELTSRGLSDDLRKWPAEDRKEMEDIALRIWQEAHKDMNDPDELWGFW